METLLAPVHYRLSADEIHAPCGVRNAKFMTLRTDEVTCGRCKKTITEANPEMQTTPVPHTPTPWTVDMIAHATDEMARSGRPNERAAFIVRAVNAHEELLEALREIKMRGGVDGEIARKAIAKAEGK